MKAGYLGLVPPSMGHLRAFWEVFPGDNLRHLGRIQKPEMRQYLGVFHLYPGNKKRGDITIATFQFRTSLVTPFVSDILRRVEA